MAKTGKNGGQGGSAGQTALGDTAWRVYVLRCADDSLYTGIARDLQRRLRQHNGELVGGPKYTRGRRPVTLAWSVVVDSHSDALQQEIAIKRLSRRAKLALISR
ncbi:MAG: GIY-YIG nuclease family protein [Halieaceae bacterium]